MDHQTLQGQRITLRAVADVDRARLRAILAEPEVARWWGLGGAGSAEAESDDDEVQLAIELDGEVVGAIQYAEEDDPDYRHASIDIFLATAVHGQGRGPGCRPDARALPVRGARPSPADDRSGGVERARDCGLRQGRLPAGWNHAAVRARAGWHVA